MGRMADIKAELIALRIVRDVQAAEIDGRVPAKALRAALNETRRQMELLLNEALDLIEG